MVEDNAQLPLMVFGNNKVNNFACPLRILLFQQLRLLSQPMVFLSKQYRIVDNLGTVVSTLFYSSQLINVPETTVEHCPISQQIIQYFKATYQVNSPLLLLQILSKTKKMQINLATMSLMHLPL